MIVFYLKLLSCIWLIPKHLEICIRSLHGKTITSSCLFCFSKEASSHMIGQLTCGWCCCMDEEKAAAASEKLRRSSRFLWSERSIFLMSLISVDSFWSNASILLGFSKKEKWLLFPAKWSWEIYFVIFPQWNWIWHSVKMCIVCNAIHYTVSTKFLHFSFGSFLEISNSS